MKWKQYDNLLTLIKQRLGSDSPSDLSCELVNLIFKKYYKTDECSYIKDKKMILLYLDLLSHFSCKGHFNKQNRHNSGDNFRTFDLKKALKRIDLELYPMKKTLFKMWKNKQFPIELKKIKANNETKSKYKNPYYKELVLNYLEYRFDLIKDIKKDLGL